MIKVGYKFNTLLSSINKGFKIEITVEKAYVNPEACDLTGVGKVS